MAEQLTIENALAWKDRFLGLIAEKKRIQFDLSEIESMDLAGAQVLIALCKECEKRNLDLSFTGELHPVMTGRLHALGLDKECSGTGDEVLALIRSML